MVCRTTSTDKFRRQRAASLIEFVVATALGALVTVVVISLMVFSGRSFVAMANYVSLDRASRNALDVMSKQIRQVKYLTNFSSTSLTFVDADDGLLAYSYDPRSRMVVRTKNGVADAKPLLTECDYINFAIYQRNPVAGSYGVYPTAVASTCKLIQLRWICSRKIYGARVNTESVQSAKIVIRKK